MSPVRTPVRAAIPASLAVRWRRLPAGDTDKTLAALHDELERSRTRLALPGQEKPYYIEYRLLDLDERTVSAQFGAVIGSTTTRNRFMSVDVRVGDYKLDSSNFISDQGFRGFLGSTGTVGIDHDYDSLRQDLWLATDQAYKEGLDNLSHKRAFLRSLANASDHRRPLARGAAGASRSAGDARLDVAQLGIGSQDGVCRVARLS